MQPTGLGQPFHVLLNGTQQHGTQQQNVFVIQQAALPALPFQAAPAPWTQPLSVHRGQLPFSVVVQTPPQPDSYLVPPGYQIITCQPRQVPRPQFIMMSEPALRQPPAPQASQVRYVMMPADTLRQPSSHVAAPAVQYAMISQPTDRQTPFASPVAQLATSQSSVTTQHTPYQPPITIAPAPQPTQKENTPPAAHAPAVSAQSSAPARSSQTQRHHPYLDTKTVKPHLDTARKSILVQIRALAIPLQLSDATYEALTDLFSRILLNHRDRNMEIHGVLSALKRHDHLLPRMYRIYECVQQMLTSESPGNLLIKLTTVLNSYYKNTSDPEAVLSKEDMEFLIHFTHYIKATSPVVTIVRQHCELSKNPPEDSALGTSDSGGATPDTDAVLTHI